MSAHEFVPPSLAISSPVITRDIDANEAEQLRLPARFHALHSAHFEDRHVRRLRRGEAAHERRRLNRAASRREERALIEARARHFGDRGFVEPLARLADARESIREMSQRRMALLVHRRVILPVVAPVALDAMRLHRAAHIVDAVPLQAHVRLVGLDTARITFAADVMRQIDEKAGIAPRCRAPDAIRFHERNGCIRREFGKPPRRAQAGDAAADHHEVEALLACHAVGGRGGRQTFPPAVHAIGCGKPHEIQFRGHSRY
jgi:hypothetical protein